MLCASKIQEFSFVETDRKRDPASTDSKDKKT